MPPSKAKAGPAKGKGKAVKNGLVMPKITGVDNAAEVEAAKGIGYYSGPTPPASIYRVALRMMMVKMNKSDDLRFTWVADISEEAPSRKKYNGYTIMNGENYSQSGLPYINKMLDAMGLDRDAFHNGGIRVDDPRIDLSDKLSKQVVEAVGKQSIGEDCGIVFYVATKSENYNNEDRLAVVQYMDEDEWERAVAGAGGVEDAADDEDEDEEEIDTEDDDEEEDEDEDTEDEDDEDEDDDEDDEEDEDEEEEDDEDDEDDEPDLSELPLKDLKARVVADDRWTNFTKTANLKGYDKDALVDMLQNGPQEEKKSKTAKTGGKAKKGTKVPF